MNNLLLYCRPGFEKEAAAEITERASNMQCYGFARVKDDSGYVIFELYDEEQADLLARKLPFRELIFIRQMLVVTHELKDLDLSDRITPILEATQGYAICGDLRVETADTNEAKELSAFCRKFTVPLRQALRGNELLTKKETRTGRCSTPSSWPMITCCWVTPTPSTTPNSTWASRVCAALLMPRAAPASSWKRPSTCSCRGKSGTCASPPA